MTFIRRKLRDREYEESIRSVFLSLNDKIYRVLLLDVSLSIIAHFTASAFFPDPVTSLVHGVTSVLSLLYTANESSSPRLPVYNTLHRRHGDLCQGWNKRVATITFIANFPLIKDAARKIISARRSVYQMRLSLISLDIHLPLLPSFLPSLLSPFRPSFNLSFFSRVASMDFLPY